MSDVSASCPYHIDFNPNKSIQLLALQIHKKNSFLILQSEEIQNDLLAILCALYTSVEQSLPVIIVSNNKHILSVVSQQIRKRLRYPKCHYISYYSTFNEIQISKPIKVVYTTFQMVSALKKADKMFEYSIMILLDPLFDDVQKLVSQSNQLYHLICKITCPQIALVEDFCSIQEFSIFEEKSPSEEDHLPKRKLHIVPLSQTEDQVCSLILSIVKDFIQNAKVRFSLNIANTTTLDRILKSNMSSYSISQINLIRSALIALSMKETLEIQSINATYRFYNRIVKRAVTDKSIPHQTLIDHPHMKTIGRLLQNRSKYYPGHSKIDYLISQIVILPKLHRPIVILVKWVHIASLIHSKLKSQNIDSKLLSSRDMRIRVPLRIGSQYIRLGDVLILPKLPSRGFDTEEHIELWVYAFEPIFKQKHSMNTKSYTQITSIHSIVTHGSFEEGLGKHYEVINRKS